MYLFLKAEQMGLFDTPVLVHGSVKKDGTVIKPHIGLRKKKIVQTQHVEQSDLFGHSEDHGIRIRRTGLESLLNKYGGAAQVSVMIRGLSEEKRKETIAKMAKIAKVKPEELDKVLAESKPETSPQMDLFEEDSEHESPTVEFSPTHLTSDGIPVIAADEPDVWMDADGNEIEDAYARKIKPPDPEPIIELPGVSFGVPAGTSKADRRRLNAAAIALLDKTEFTETDKAILRQYSGNGGCGDSLNEFYTDTEVAAAIWSVADRLGYKSGTFLEPSSGTGVFLHTAPAGFKATAVELDPISAKIAEILHGDRHEVHNASLERFATQDMTQFDVVVGNPPYGPRGFLAKEDKINLSKAEEYFIDTSLDKTLPGGLCALVVPAGIMDSKNGRKFRERVLRKAEFLGAQRMPNTAFEAAHTDVTADIVYFRKRPDDIAGALGVVDPKILKKIGVWDDEFLSGKYFEGRGAHNVFGTAGTAMRAYGEVYTVNGSMRGVPQEITKFVAHAVGSSPTMPEILEAVGPDGRNKALNGAESRPYQSKGKRGDLRVIDGVQYVLTGNPLRWHLVDEAQQTEAVTSARPIAMQIDRLMSGGQVDREQLQKDIQEWAAKNGIPAESDNLLVAAATDKLLYRLIGAVGKDGELSDAVSGRTLSKIEGGFDAVAQALALAHDSSDFTAGELAEKLGAAIDEVEDNLVASDQYAYAGSGRWSPMEIYLTGDLWPKLDSVNSEIAGSEAPSDLAEKYKLQAELLEKTIGPKSLEDVEIMISSAFIPSKVLTAWSQARIDKLIADNPSSSWYKTLKPMAVDYKDGFYTVTDGEYDTKLIGQYLNRTGVRQDDKPKIDRLNEEFKDWLLTSSFRDEIEELYNRKFRGFVPQEYSEEPIDIPGLANKDKIKPYAWSGLRWALSAGRGIIADDVGLGKTLRGLLLARIAKIDGTSKKPIIVVPKSVLANWHAESQKWFPGSRVMTIGAEFTVDDSGEMKGRDDDPSERKRKYHDLSQNDYDFILISEPAFQELDLDPITKHEMYEKDFWVQRGKALGQAGDKVVNRIRENYNQAIAKREFTDKTDAIYFNELGIDMILADEAHHYKGLYSIRNRYGESPMFFGGGKGSMRALDFNLKSKWLLENNNNHGVYGLSATPTKNSPLEIYNMVCHVAPDAWGSLGIRNSEDFIDRFCEFGRDNVLALDGTLNPDALIVSGFKNMDELREIMKRYINRRTAEQVGLELPKRSDHLHAVEMSDKQKQVYDELRQELEESAKEKDATGDSHIFSIMSRMAKAALDLEVLDTDKYAGEKSPKYKSLAKHVVEGIADGGQIVFCDSVVAHEKIVNALVEAGIPRNQIGVINAKAASSSVARQNIADKFNAGKLKVVVGNTDTMGEGMNLQMGTADIHDLDTPWTPAALQQRHGRGLRQGNINELVRIHSYLSKGSFDGYRYQTTAGKKDWQDMLWTGGDRVDNLMREGKFSRADMLIMMSSDPDATRAAIESNAELAQQQLAAGQRLKISGEFVKFQEMKQSYGALKNKGSQSAERLRQRIRDTETSLKSNKYFNATAAIDSNTDALIQPETGEVFHAGVAFSADEKDGADAGKHVVTGVNLRAGTVTFRPYASLETGRTRTVRIADLAHGIVPFKYEESAEKSAVSDELAKQAEGKLNNITSYKDVMAMPSHVLEAAHDSIQRQLKEKAAKYEIHDLPSRDIPVINKETGEPKLFASYDKLGDTYDYLLPTEANKQKIADAWAHEERNAKFRIDYATAGRSRRGSTQKTDTHAVKKYAGASYDDIGGNPWRKLVAEINGEQAPSYYTGADSNAVKKLREKFASDQMQKIRSATTMQEAFSAALPLGHIQEKTEGYSAKVKYPKKALAMLWAKAKELGVLGDARSVHEPGKESTLYGKIRTLPEHSAYAYGKDDATIHNTLIKMARLSGDRTLAAAMAESGIKNHPENDAKNTIKVLTDGYGSITKQEARSALRLAEKAGLADMTLSDAGIGSNALSPTRAYYGDPAVDDKRTVRQVLESRLNAK